jgi:hypothetical protein
MRGASRLTLEAQIFLVYICNINMPVLLSLVALSLFSVYLLYFSLVLYAETLDVKNGKDSPTVEEERRLKASSQEESDPVGT